MTFGGCGLMSGQGQYDFVCPQKFPVNGDLRAALDTLMDRSADAGLVDATVAINVKRDGLAPKGRELIEVLRREHLRTMTRRRSTPAVSVPGWTSCPLNVCSYASRVRSWSIFRRWTISG